MSFSVRYLEFIQTHAFPHARLTRGQELEQHSFTADSPASLTMLRKFYKQTPWNTSFFHRSDVRFVQVIWGFADLPQAVEMLFFKKLPG